MSINPDSNHASFIIKITIVFLLSVFMHSTAQAQQYLAPEQIEGVARVTAEQVFDLVVNEPELIIIDSRKQEQFSKGHIQGALNILDTKMTENLLAEYVNNKTVPVIFYCNGERCLRSANASSHAYEWGYKRIYWFRGGWEEWTEKQMPVSRIGK